MPARSKGTSATGTRFAAAVAGCDYVFHQAAIRITLCAAHPRDCIDVLVDGTFNVFEAAAAAEGVKKVVYASSASVYGAAEVFPTDEKHHPYGNRTLYGAAKLMDEGIARHFHDMNGLPSVGLRYFNVYGPRMDVTGAYTEVFIRWLDCAEKGVRPQIHGDGSTTMDFVYVGDIARANVLAMKSDRTDDVYNVASGTETSLLDLWQAIQRSDRRVPPRSRSSTRRARSTRCRAGWPTRPPRPRRDRASSLETPLDRRAARARRVASDRCGNDRTGCRLSLKCHDDSRRIDRRSRSPSPNSARKKPPPPARRSSPGG